MGAPHVQDLVNRIQEDRSFRARVDAIASDADLGPLLTELNQDGFEGDLHDLVEAIRSTRPPRVAPSGPRPVPAADAFDMGLKFQQGLVNVVEEIDRGYRHVMRMYLVAFYLGVGLVITAVVLAIAGRSEVMASVLGTLGIADVVAGMVFRPTQELQTSRGNLAQLQAAFTGWANDIFNWNQYLNHLDRHAEKLGQPPPFEQVERVSAVVMANTETIMRLIEEYCEEHPVRAADQ